MKGERRSTRISNDGRTSMEKAQDNKKKEALEENYTKGKAKRTMNPITSKHVLNIVDVVDISLGRDEGEVAISLESCLEHNEIRSNSEVGRPIWPASTEVEI
jgi:hypothetical protein